MWCVFQRDMGRDLQQEVDNCTGTRGMYLVVAGKLKDLNFYQRGKGVKKRVCLCVGLDKAYAVAVIKDR